MNRSPAELMGYLNGIDATKTTRTHNKYSELNASVLRFCAGKQIAPVTPERFVTALKTMVDEKALAESTARTHKAAAQFWLAEQARTALDAGADLSPFVRAYDDVHAMKPPVKKSPRVSEETERGFPGRIIDILESALSADYPNLESLLAFCRANLLVGLRPIEWLDVQFDVFDAGDGSQTTPMLRVENAKQAHKRVNDPVRELILHGITQKQLACLILWKKLLADETAGKDGSDKVRAAEDHYKSLRQTLKRILKRHAPELAASTLYNTRHQCMADCKASGFSRREIAAFFGHHSASAAWKHHADSAYGVGHPVRFRPSPSSLRSAASCRTPALLSSSRLTVEAMEEAGKLLSRKN